MSLRAFALFLAVTPALAGNLILDRPLRAQSATLSELRQVEMSFGFEYVKATGPDLMGSPFHFLWTLDPHWQLRIASVGWTGEAVGYLSYSELHDIKLGAQYRYLVGSPLDLAVRAYVVGVDIKKQRAILTHLASTTWLNATWHLMAEVTTPLQATAPRLQGTIALGGQGWVGDSLGWGAGYFAELPDKLSTQHFIQGALYLKVAQDVVLDVGAQTEIGGTGTNYQIMFGVSTFLGKM